MTRRKVEILAPAGSFDSMKAAVAAGADAVYIGGARFGARAYANNLDQQDMLKAIEHCHLHDVSLYMTVNTLMKETELKELDAYLAPFYEGGLDAVIVQDLGAFSHIRKAFPDLPIHASTQMTITGPEGARMLKDLGASRIVTARELSLLEIRKIRDQVDVEIESFVHGALCYCYSGQCLMVDVEIESFVHGALCYCYSGQCLMSSFIGGRSGNRGRCAQPCRLPYETPGLPGEKGKTALLSLKDLCTLDLLPDIIEAGVYSLKIEGRMKSPRYTAGVVEVYRKYADRYLQYGRKGYRVEPEDRRILLELFDRGGQTEGYYEQHNGRDMVVLNGKPAFRESDQKLLDRLDRQYVQGEKKEAVCGQAWVTEGEPVIFEVWLSGKPEVRAQAIGERVQTAQNQPMTEEKLVRPLGKTGNTPFVFERLSAAVSGQVFVPVQALNELRRNALSQLENRILEEKRRTWRGNGQPDRPKGASLRQEKGQTLSLQVLLSGPRGLLAALACQEVKEILVESDGWEPSQWKTLSEQCRNAGKRCILAMPVIFRTHGKKYFDAHLEELREAGFDGLLVRSLEEIGYLKDRNMTCPLYGDHNLYVFNREAEAVMEELGLSRLTFPLELNGREMEELQNQSEGDVPMDLVAYGSHGSGGVRLSSGHGVGPVHQTDKGTLRS